MRKLAIWLAMAAAVLAACSVGSRVTAGTGNPAPHVTATTAPAVAASAVPSAARKSSAAARPVPDACAHNTLAQRVIVDVSAQHAWLCAHAHTVYQTAVTTGAVALPYDSTPLGTFHVQSRSRDVPLTLIDGSVYHVHYWVPFDAPLFGFHDAGWQKIPFGSAAYRTQGSHGCVHMPLAAMAYLFRWADVGAAVTIRA